MNWYRESQRSYSPLNASRRIDSQTLTDEVLNLHYGDQDTAEQEESDLPERIGKYEWYDLKQIPISQIPHTRSPDSSPFDIDEEKIERLKEMMSRSKNYPPIVVNDKFEVEDGNHRVFALKELGVNRVWAYVPDLKESSS